METTIEGNILSDDFKRSFQESNTAKKLDSIFKKKVKNNFKNIEPLSQMDILYNTKPAKENIKEGFAAKCTDNDEPPINNDPTFSLLSEEEKAEVKKKMEKKVQEIQENTDQFFADMGYTLDSTKGTDLKTLKGWKRLFELIIYFFPGLIKLCCKRFVKLDFMRNEECDTMCDYKKSQKNDTEWLVQSSYEFCQIFLAIIFANVLFYRIVILKPPLQAEILVKTPNEDINNFLYKFFLLFLVFLPNTFHFIVYNVLRKYVVHPIKNYPTICYLLFYCLSLFFCSFFMDKITRMFLEVFDLKANPMIYMFIVFGFIAYITNLNMFSKGLLAMSSIAYVIYIVIHLLISVTFAPVAQLIFTLYMLLFFSGGGYIYNIFFSPNNEINTAVAKSKKPDYTFLGGFDSFLYKFVYQYFSTFMLLIFFFYKTLHALIPPTGLQIFNLRLGFSIVNISATLLLASTYFTSLFKSEDTDLEIRGDPTGLHTDTPEEPINPVTTLSETFDYKQYNEKSNNVEVQPEVQPEGQTGVSLDGQPVEQTQNNENP
jgi:hypothetical protein